MGALFVDATQFTLSLASFLLGKLQHTINNTYPSLCRVLPYKPPLSSQAKLRQLRSPS